MYKIPETEPIDISKKIQNKKKYFENIIYWINIVEQFDCDSVYIVFIHIQTEYDKSGSQNI